MKCPSRSRLLSALAVSLAIGGCGDASSLGEPAADVARKESALSLAQGTSVLWPLSGGFYTVPLCWATAGYPREKQIIQRAIERSWVFNAGIATRWSPTCPTTGTESFVKVQIGRRGMVGSPPAYDHGASGATRGYGTNTLSPPAALPYDLTATPGITIWVEDNETSYDYSIAWAAVHEFGHVLGFADASAQAASVMNQAFVPAPGDQGGLYEADAVDLRMRYPALPAQSILPNMIYRDPIYGRVNVVGIFNGTTPRLLRDSPSASLGFQFAGSGNFTGATSDYQTLWRKPTTGVMILETISPPTGTRGGSMLPTTRSEWKVIGTSDFNGDGITDILWQDTTNGEIRIWVMTSGGAVRTEYPLVGGGGSELATVGVGDFDGDGTSDFLMRYASTGDVHLIKMNRGSITEVTYVGYPRELLFDPEDGEEKTAYLYPPR